jgi:hypothetical protein
MIICFECDPETKRLLDELIRKGHYRNFGEAISTAISNLAILQDEISKSGALIFDKHSAVDKETIKPGPEKDSISYAPHDYSSVKSPRSTARAENVKAKPSIPSVFRLNGLEKPLSSFASAPMDLYAIGSEVPLDRWIFGQYNRLLPAKASCRALSRIMAGKSRGVDLDDAAQQIAEKAVLLGEYLKHLDEKHNIGRDDALSTAFPTKGKNSAKSRLRYASQFVASVNRHGQVSGLLIDLKLINRTSGGTPRVNLTEQGWKFTLMKNPILDGNGDVVNSKFSQEEVDFLLDHISTNVPAEHSAYQSILGAISNGAITPDDIDNFLTKYIDPSRKEELSPSFLSTQRSGAISRMSDLGLVERDRDGVYVSYIATDLGKSYLRRNIKTTE